MLCTSRRSFLSITPRLMLPPRVLAAEMQVEEHHADTVAEEAALRPPQQ